MPRVAGQWKAILFPLLLVVAVVLQHTLPTSFSAVWFGGWPILTFFAALAISFRLAADSGWLRAGTFLWVSLSAIGVGLMGMGFPASGTTHWNAGEVTNISVLTSARMFCISSYLSFLGMAAIAYLMSARAGRFLGTFLGVAGLVTAISIIRQSLRGSNVAIQVAMFDNPSMAATFAVFGILYLISEFRRYKIPYLLITGLMIHVCFIVRATTPATAAAVGLLVLGLQGRKTVWKVAILSALVAAAIFFFPTRNALESDASGRFGFWTALIEYWTATPVRTWFGAGIGTSKILAPLLTNEGIFFWHSSILQIGFELGVVGLLLSSGTGAICMYNNRYDPGALAVACAFGMAMVTNFVATSPGHALWLVFLCRRNHDGPRVQVGSAQTPVHPAS